MTPRRRFNTWRDPVPKPPDYLSPHCSSGQCQYCRGRRAARHRAEQEARAAAQAPSMFWDTPLFPGTKWDLGPSAPSSRIQTFVKPP